MKKIFKIEDIEDDFVLTIGNFDGVHVGHQEILKNIKKYCQRNNLKLCVVTFVPHPIQILSPRNNHLINTYNERQVLLESNNVDYLLEIDFNRDFSTMSAKEFLDGHILTTNKMKVFFIGHDFAFGANKSGDCEFIKSYCTSKNMPVEVLNRFDKENKTISSSLIRNELALGNVSYVNTCLGREFFIRGRVIKGAGRGKTIGIPTANLEYDLSRVIPKLGVYSSKIKIKNQTWLSVTNIGYNPTFTDEKKINIETHILDFDNDIYGDEVELIFFERIRDEQRFDSVNSLLNQINKDIEFVRLKIAYD